MVNIGAITGAVSGTVGVLKEIRSLAKSVGSREINEHLIDLQQRIIEVQGLFTELMAENESLRTQVAELKNAAKIDGELKFEESVYWQVQDGKRIDGPICPNCWDSNRKRVHLTSAQSPGVFYCGVCKSENFYTKAYRRASPEFLSLGVRKFEEL